MQDAARRYLAGELITLLRLTHADPRRWECRRIHQGDPEPAGVGAYRVVGAGGQSAPHHLEGAQFVASRMTEPVRIRCKRVMINIPSHLIAVERDAYLDKLETLSVSWRIAHHDLMQISFPLIRITSEGYVRRNTRITALEEECAQELFSIAHVRELVECVA